MSKVFDVGAEHQPFELRAEIVRLQALADDLRNELQEHRAEVERLTAERDALRAENAAMLDILRPFFPLIVPPGCDVWEMVKAAVSALRNRLADEGPVRTDVWVGGRSDGEARL